MINKIVIFSGSYPIDQLGATKTIDINLSESLSKLGLNVSLISVGTYSSNNVHFYSLSSSKIEYIVSVLKKISSILNKRNQFQIIINRIYDMKMSALISRNKIILDSKSLFIARNGMSYLSIAEAKKKGALTLLHSQWTHPHNQNKLLNEEYKRLGIKVAPISKRRINLQKKEIEIVDKIWCISNLVYESYIENGLDPKKIFNMPLGVNIDKYNISNNSKQIYRNRKDNFKILFVGSINYEKGAHILLEALRIGKLENIEIIFNGYTNSKFISIFQKYKKALELKNINVITQPGNPCNNYLKASIFVLPSIHDSFGLVTLEAMASGLPIIITNTVGSKDCVRDNIDGFIVKSNDVKQLNEKIEYFYHNRDQIEVFGKNAIKNASKFTWQRISQEIKDTILCDSKSTGIIF